MDTVTLYSYSWWINQLNKDEKRLKDEWWHHADKIVKKYKAKRAEGLDGTQYLLNIFWANVGVMKAALYGKQPRPVVRAIWQDPDDSVGRVAALILERCLSYDLMKNKSPMDYAIRLAVEDWLIPGLGAIWFRYESEIESVEVPNTPVKVDVVRDERVACDYVHWRDLIMPAARTSEEVWYIGRKVYMTKADIKARFDVTVPDDEENKSRDADNILPKNFTEDKVCLYELWCRKNRKVYWVCREIPDFCEVKDDFLKLEDFYPCPMPLMATHTTDNYLPRPDYLMMKDQYDQLNELNTRIVILEKALRVVGVYDKKNEEVKRILSEARENDMIPVDKWAMLAEGGGLKGVVDWFPLDMISEVLEKLSVQKAEKKQEIYELSGISDIMRGASNPRETLGAQKLKAQFGSIRLEARQDEIAQFVKRGLAIKAEIICEHFQPENIAKLSNIMSTSDAQLAEQAIQMLKDEKLLQYKVDINEQILSLPDYQQEQENRMEFLTTTGQFLSQAAPMVEAVPGALPHLINMIKWTASSFKGANEMEGVLDQAMQAAQGMPMQKPGEDDGTAAENIKQQGALAIKQAEGQAKMQEIKLAKDLELRNLLEVEQLKQTGGVKEMLGETILGQQQHVQTLQQNQQAQQHEHAMSVQDQQHEHELSAQEAAHENEAGETAHQQALEMADVSHQNSLEQGAQSGDVQLEVSKMRQAAGNKAKNK